MNNTAALKVWNTAQAKAESDESPDCEIERRVEHSVFNFSGQQIPRFVWDDIHDMTVNAQR